MPVKTKARGGPKGRQKADSIRQMARDLGRAPATCLRWVERGCPQKKGKARDKWIAENTIPESELRARRSLGQRSGSWATKQAEECRLLRARIRLERHALRLRVAKLVKRSAARREIKRVTAEVVAMFADVPELLAELVEGDDTRALLVEMLRKQVDNAMRSLRHRQ